jgi:hypothetical protein
MQTIRTCRTVKAWKGEILSTGGCFNERTKVLNLLVKKVKRVGHGFRNFAYYGCGCWGIAAWRGTVTGPQACETATLLRDVGHQSQRLDPSLWLLHLFDFCGRCRTYL